MPSNPVEQLRKCGKLRKRFAVFGDPANWDKVTLAWFKHAEGQHHAAFMRLMADLDYPALLATIDRLQRIEAAAKAADDEWQAEPEPPSSSLEAFADRMRELHERLVNP